METDKNDTVAAGSSRHTLALIAILLGIALTGFLAQQRSTLSAVPPPGAGLYIGLLAAEWGLFAYVRDGLRRYGSSVGDLISARRLSARMLAADFLLGILLLAILIGVEFLLSKLVGAGKGALAHALLVRRLAQVPLWILLALSAGFVEEITFRGYLQRQFGAWIKNPWLGVAAQAILFGLTHGYQGPASIIVITILGLIFGTAALLRRSLVPGIVAHAGLDITAGLALFR